MTGFTFSGKGREVFLCRFDGRGLTDCFEIGSHFPALLPGYVFTSVTVSIGLHPIICD